MTTENRRETARTTHPAAAGTLVRPHLLDRIDAAVASGSRLVLLAGPPGAGVTTLVAQWASGRGHPAPTWVDAARWDAASVGNLLGALQEATGRSYSSTAAAAAPGDAELGSPGIEALADELTGVAEAVLVLDGWPSPDPAPLLVQLGSALASSSNCGLLVLAAGRAAPAPGFGKLRLQGSVALIDDWNLSLTPAEVAAAGAARGVAVDPGSAQAIWSAVEGWAAGVAMILGEFDGPGDPRHAVDRGLEAIFDYLATEVVDRWDEPTRELLRTVACLPVLDPGLCDRLIGRRGSGRILEQRRRARDFVSVHTGEGDALRYRLHRVLRHMLRRQNELRGVDEERVLREAADWYEDRGELLAAAECLRELRDLDRWHALMEVHAPTLLIEPDLGPISSFAATLPRSFLRLHNEHALATAFLHLSAGKPADAIDLLRALAPTFDDGAAALASLLSASAFAFDADMGPSIAAADDAIDRLDRLPDDHPFPDLSGPAPTSHYRMQARGARLLAGAWAGEWELTVGYDPEPDRAIAIAEMPAVSQVRSLGPIACALALVGRFGDAEGLASASLLALPSHDPWADATSDYAHWAMATVHLARLELDEAHASLDRCEQRARPAGRRNLVASSVAARAHLLVDRRQPESAIALLATFESDVEQAHPPVVRSWLATASARAHTARGDLDQATRALESVPLSSWVRSATLGVALAAGDRGAARNVVDRWPIEGTALGTIRRELGLAAVQASEGGHRAASQHVARALRLAGPSRIAHPLIEFGAYLVKPLRRIATHSQEADAAMVAASALRFVEPKQLDGSELTTKEVLVLHHLASGATLADVADRLVLSVNTVKTHVKAIYRKLEVATRGEAVDRWRALGGSPD